MTTTTPIAHACRPAAPQPDTSQLMDAFRRERSSAAFERLYAASAPDLLDWIRHFAATRRFALDPHEALQDTFVNIYRYAGSFRPEASGGFRAWARTIAGNVIRRSRMRPHSAGTLFIDCEDGIDRLMDRRAAPLAHLEGAEAMRSIAKGYALLLQHYAAAYATLKERDRAALFMVEVEGLDYLEVGRRLGTARSNTKMIVFRARKRLLAALAASLGLEPAADEAIAA